VGCVGEAEVVGEAVEKVVAEELAGTLLV